MKRISWMVLGLWLGAGLWGGLAADGPAAEQMLARARGAYESWQYAEALKLYRVLATKLRETGGAEASVRVADCLFHLGRYAEAAEAYSEAITEHPNSSARYYPRLKVADCLVKQDRLEDARRLYEAAQKSYGESLGDFSVAGRIGWLRGN